LVDKHSSTLLAPILPELLKALALTALWAHKPPKQPILHNRIYFKLPIKPVFRHWPVNRAWQALSPVLANPWQPLRLAQDKPLPVLAQAQLKPHKPRVLERKALLTQHGSKPLPAKRRWGAPRVLVKVLQKLPELALVEQHSRLEQIPQPLFKRHVKLLPVPEQLLDKPVKALLVRPLPQVSALWAQFKALGMWRQAGHKLLAQPVYLARILQHKLDWAHVWAQQARQPVWGAYLTQRGSRLNNPQQAVLARIKTLWQRAKLAYKALVVWQVKPPPEPKVLLI
jgi:hypothetical protein